jgi:hypothetical protein
MQKFLTNRLPFLCQTSVGWLSLLWRCWTLFEFHGIVWRLNHFHNTIFHIFLTRFRNNKMFLIMICTIWLLHFAYCVFGYSVFALPWGYFRHQPLSTYIKKLKWFRQFWFKWCLRLRFCVFFSILDILFNTHLLAFIWIFFLLDAYFNLFNILPY